jgi:hypothetical protein
VVVLVGLTVWLPDAETLPMPWSMLTVVAPVVLQVRVAELPVVMLTGLAVKDPIEGGVGAVVVSPRTPDDRGLDPAEFVALTA